MAHVLIFGMTESGKTTLAKRLAHRYRQNGIPVIVLDSLNDPEWPTGDDTYQTTDPDDFLRVFWASKRCACFVDEAGDAVGRYNLVMQKTATRGRHWGHSVHFISQRGVQIAPTVRDQCSHLFLLTSSIADGKVHANEWNRQELLKCNALGKGNYFHCTRFGVISQGSLFGVKNGFDTHSEHGGRDVSDKPARSTSKGREKETQSDSTGIDITTGTTGARDPADPSRLDTGAPAESASDAG